MNKTGKPDKEIYLCSVAEFDDKLGIQFTLADYCQKVLVAGKCRFVTKIRV